MTGQRLDRENNVEAPLSRKNTTTWLCMDKGCPALWKMERERRRRREVEKRKRGEGGEKVTKKREESEGDDTNLVS